MSGSSRNAPLEGSGKRLRMDADLAVVNQRLLAFVDELDGVFDRDDVILPVQVSVVDQRGERGRFAGTGRPGDEDQPFLEQRKTLQHRRQTEVVAGEHLARDEPEHGGDAVLLVEEVGPVAGHAGDLVAEIHVARFLEDLDLHFRRDFVDHRLEFVVGQRGVIHADEVAVDAQHRRVARGKMEVRGFLLGHQFEEGVDPGHRRSLRAKNCW